MIKVNDIREVQIEKLVFGSEGIARSFEDNFVIFVKDVLPDEIIKVQITSVNKRFARAKVLEIISPSKNRKKPFCALYNACGSCNMQICDYDFSVIQKDLILKEVFKNALDETLIKPLLKSPQIQEYRHKVQYPARQTKNSKRVLLGYFRENSHNLTNIKFCPIQPKIANEIAQYIRDNLSFDCYSEKTNKGLLKNVLMRFSHYNNDILLTLVLNIEEKEFEKRYKNIIQKFCSDFSNEFKQIKGFFVNFNSSNSNNILGKTTLKILGQDYIIEKLSDKKYQIGATSFFQVNPLSAINLFDVVKQNIKENSTILDAYGGVGAIGIYVSEKANKIVLVEENKNAILMAKENFKINNIENYEIFEGDAKKHFKNFEKEKRTFDYIILDPPRSGCDKEGLKTFSKLTKNIIYVSCNLQTLKRDMLYLFEEGYSVKCLQGVDLFPHTHHIECVAVFEKKDKND